MRIVVTGGAGSGKSTVINRLKEVMGSETTFRSVDEIVKNIHRCPEHYLDGDNLKEWKKLVDVPNLREAVFNDSSLRLELERLSIPGVLADLRIPFPTPHMVLEFPLLFEKCSHRQIVSYDVLVILHCPASIRRARCALRGWSNETINHVFASQISDANRVDMVAEYLPRMRVISIDTSASIESVVEATSEIIQVMRPA